MMKSYSKVFKASHVSVLDEVKVITPPFRPNSEQSDDPNITSDEGDGKSLHQINRIMEETEAKAQALLVQAEQNARTIEAAAQEKINQWWQENEQKLTAVTEEAKQQGYHDGFKVGKQEATEEIHQTYQAKIDQVQQLLEQGYAQKEAIIAEAEPFLLELSTAIAAQIVRQELKSHPDQFVELIKQHILRFKEKEFITVCVHPDDFEFVQSQRSHLVAVVNGETEIKVIPDHSVTPEGCIIRTAYGSVDARIDTQIEEIKKVILEAGRNPDDGTIS
ncbi:flagellar assembly protein FliH [Neobacillus jeddahensis]|uniref:flagellar assembly protein FliH n=2 Tax=Neobacillus jeddahensis TaxID=1461580 RepID=UPI001C54A75E|nr:flagellar assembly protein FliH [Neobacillus jeddahensis]